MKKLVINGDYGGFSVSNKAIKLYAELKGITLYPFKWGYSTLSSAEIIEGKSPYKDTAVPISWEEVFQPKRHILDIISFSTEPIEEGNVPEQSYYSHHDFKRDDPFLVQVVEQLGADANGSCASLKIVEIPDDVEWEIEEYDGSEWVSEVHRTWR